MKSCYVFRCFFLILIVQSCCLPSIGAESIFRPAGLTPGDEYRLAFVTDGKRNAVSGNIAHYNSFVESQANATGSIASQIQATWKAIASTSRINAVENTDTDPTPAGANGVPVYLLDGRTRIADDYDNLWDGDSWGQTILLAPLRLTQYGVPSPRGINDVWTGTDYYGVTGGIGGPLGSSFPSLGASIASNGRWIDNNFSSFFQDNKSLYAISSVLVAVPEPSATALLGILILGSFLPRAWSHAQAYSPNQPTTRQH